MILVLAFVIMSGAVTAEPPTFIEGALIDGGENGRNGSADQFGFEVTGDYGINEHWYVGGILGRFNADTTAGDVQNTYFNAHGGYLFDVAEDTDVVVEAGLWLGNQDNIAPTPDTDPQAFELKAGVTQSLSKSFSIFGTLAWVNGDLDTPSNSNLRNYVWSLGAAYNIGEHWGINLKIVNGFNGVHGQNQVLRFGGRYRF